MNHNRLYGASMQNESVKKELNVLLMVVYVRCCLDKTKMNTNETNVELMIENEKKRLVQPKVQSKLMNAFDVSACDVDSVHWKTRIERTPIVFTGPKRFQQNTKTNVFKISSSKHPCRCWNRLCVLFVISGHFVSSMDEYYVDQIPNQTRLACHPDLLGIIPGTRSVPQGSPRYLLENEWDSLSFQILPQIQPVTAYPIWFYTRKDALPQKKRAAYVIDAMLHWLRIKCHLFL